MSRVKFILLWLIVPVVSFLIRITSKNRWWKPYRSSIKEMREDLYFKYKVVEK